MALPKKKIDLVLNPIKVGSEYLKYGFDRIEELMLKTNQKTNYLPRTIKLRDIDAAMFDFVKNKDMKLILDGKDVPVFYLTKERWGEFAKTWQFTDNDQNVLTPYMTVRRIKREFGSRMGNKKYTVAQHKRFTYVDVPILDEGQVINLRFKVPQPTSVDMTYEVRLFSKYQNDMNLLDELVLDIFSSRQSYCWIKGNPFAIHCDTLEEEHIQDIKGDRMYVNVYQLKVLAFVQNEKNFEIVKTSRAPKLSVGLATSKNNMKLDVNQNKATGGSTFDSTFDETFS